jgi:hypothetical protein
VDVIKNRVQLKITNPVNKILIRQIIICLLMVVMYKLIKIQFNKFNWILHVEN